MAIKPSVASRMSAAERRLKLIEATVGSQPAVNELTDFPEKSDWVSEEMASTDSKMAEIFSYA